MDEKSFSPGTLIANGEKVLFLYSPKSDEVLLDSSSTDWVFSGEVGYKSTFVVLSRRYTDSFDLNYIEVLSDKGIRGFIPALLVEKCILKGKGRQHERHDGK